MVPSSRLAGYAGAPLARKLGIKPTSVLVLVAAPRGFEKTLGRLPERVNVRRQPRAGRDLTLWFTTSRNDLERRIARMAAAIGDGRLWIVWPKKAAGMDSDLSQATVRRVGLVSGLVDYKICALDERWSGLLFSRRRSR